MYKYNMTLNLIFRYLSLTTICIQVSSFVFDLYPSFLGSFHYADVHYWHYCSTGSIMGFSVYHLGLGVAECLNRDINRKYKQRQKT